MSTIAVKKARLANGLTLPYAEAGYPGGMPVVFVHALAESWRSFEPLLGMLPVALHGFAPTQRGHGDADKPAEGYTPEDYAADLVAFMDAVGVDRAILVGGSGGGVTARIVAGGHPDRVAGLVMIGTPATLADKPGVAELAKAFAALPDPPDRASAEFLLEGATHDPLPQDFHETMLTESMKAPARVWQATMRGLLDADLRATLGGILVPTLLLWGDRDRFLPREDQQAILDASFGARLAVFENTGHLVHWEEPARVVTHLVDFAAHVKPSPDR